MQEGYIRLYRCILDNPWSRHPDYLAVWVYCLLRGTYKECDVVTKNGGVVHLLPGQFITSREQISVNTGVQESKVERALKLFKSEQQIEQQNCGKFRIISIVNWGKYQAREQDNEQYLNNRRTTGEQQVNTDNKVKEGKEVKPSPRKKPSGDHAAFIDWWCWSYEKLAQRPYAMSAKEAAHVKFILSQFSFKDAIAIACHFLLVEDKFFQGRRDLGMMRANINRLPAPERCDIATARDWGILPPQGTMFEDWDYRTEEAA